ncbi:unnamed protein product, partial [marine sediment metagenome]
RPEFALDLRINKIEVYINEENMKTHCIGHDEMYNCTPAPYSCHVTMSAPVPISPTTE